MTVDAENESKNIDPMDPRADWSKPSLAVIANNNGQGCVLWTAGPHVAIDLEQIGTDLADIGLDDAPHGISIWEGKTVGAGDDARLVGKFRVPTPPEWDAITRNVNPWDDDAWLIDPEVAEGLRQFSASMSRDVFAAMLKSPNKSGEDLAADEPESEPCLDSGAAQPHHCPAADEGPGISSHDSPHEPYWTSHHPECNDPHCNGGC